MKPDDNPVDILIVDDLPEKLLVYECVLEELGQNLVKARSGAEALRLVMQQEFAVILLDVQMPGMDGFETATLIGQRKKSAHTPIIFLTAFTDEMRVAQGYASGAVDYLPTPVVPEILRAKVRVFVELFRMRRQAAARAEEQTRRAAAEEAARRAEFLSAVSESVSRSLDFSETVRSLVAAPLTTLADACIFQPVDEGRENDLAQCAWVETSGRIVHGASPSCDVKGLQQLIEQVSQGAATPLLARLPVPEGECSATDTPADQRSYLAANHWQAALVLPVASVGSVHGVLALLRGPQRLDFSSSDQSLAQEFASRAAIALENARLMRSIREADQRKDAFLGMLAHELRNPLGPIRNAVQILKLSGSSDEGVVHVRDLIDRQVTHMVRLVDDLLDATRIARGKVLLRQELCDLTRIVRETTADYRSLFDEKSLRLAIDVPSTPVWIHGDATRLAQSLGNLLHNAHKFTDAGGAVEVTLTTDPQRSEASIRVRDTGIGIAAEMLPSVFDVFRQADQGLDRSRGGLGLGLALVKGLVELHGGQVAVASAGPQCGTELELRLPLAPAPTESVLDKPAPGAPTANGKLRILLIEDNADAAHSMRLLLDYYGHAVHTACSGDEGLKIAARVRPNVVLCDIGLPGMSGYEVARTLSRDSAGDRPYLIALTGYGREEDQQMAHDAGFDLHLTKPVASDDLQLALSSVPPAVQFHGSAAV